MSIALRFLLGLAFTVVFWPTAVLVVLFVSLISGLFLDRESHRGFGQWILGTSLGHFVAGLEILGIIRVSDDDLKRHADAAGPLIIACNHPALWDAVLVIRRFVRLSCIMKQDLLGNPLLRNGALFAGFLPNFPQFKMVRHALDCLADGGRLLLFPEGTRTRSENGLINPFRPGLALLAKQSGAPILPIFIASDSPYLQKHWPIWRMPKLPIHISLRTGERIQILPGEKVRDFSARLERIFRNELGGDFGKVD